jgi:hypothetical protein
MTASAQSIATEPGPLAVRDLAPGTRAALEELFPTVTEIEHEGHCLLGLVPIEGPRVLEGLRTGYGYGGPQPPDAFARMLAIERLRIVEATACFVLGDFEACSFRGVPGRHAARSLLMPCPVPQPSLRAVAGYGPRSGRARRTPSSPVKEILDSWQAAGVAGMQVTDMEPCPANWDGMKWRADIALVDDRIVVLRQQLSSEDPLLAALVASGVSEIEYTPSVFLLPPPEGSDHS